MTGTCYRCLFVDLIMTNRDIKDGRAIVWHGVCVCQCSA